MNLNRSKDHGIQYFAQKIEKEASDCIGISFLDADERRFTWIKK